MVACKDTPNFIANRIGTFFGSTIQKITVEDGYTIEEVDALTGPLIGLPKSASYRLLDIVGLDVWAMVTRNLHDMAAARSVARSFRAAAVSGRDGEARMAGRKARPGLVQARGKRREKEIWAIDWKTLEYHPAQKPRFPSVDAARNIEDLGERLRMLVAAADRAGSFLWKLFSDLFLYSAGVVPEISDRVVEIDRAMRWGYANKLGPFELWDALGFEATTRRMESEGRSFPENRAPHAFVRREIVLSAGGPRWLPAHRVLRSGVRGLPRRSKSGRAFWLSATSSARAAW